MLCEIVEVKIPRTVERLLCVSSHAHYVIKDEVFKLLNFGNNGKLELLKETFRFKSHSACERKSYMAKAKKLYTVADIESMTKVELRELVTNGALLDSGTDVLSASLKKLATKSANEPKVVIAKRVYTKDVIDRRTSLVKYPKDFTQDLADKNLRNVLLVQAKRIHPRDEALALAQVDLFVKDIMDGKPFHATNYVISKV